MGTFWALNGWQMAAVLLGLLIFGVLYNALVARLQRRTRHYTSECVAGGVLVTVLASGLLIGFENALLVLACFVASGMPMMAGSWMRHILDEEAARIAAQELLYDDK